MTKLILGAVALIGLAVAGVGIYRLAIGGNDGGSIVSGGIFIMMLLVIFNPND